MPYTEDMNAQEMRGCNEAHMDHITLHTLSERIRDMELAVARDGGPLSRGAWQRLTGSMPGWARITEGT